MSGFSCCLAWFVLGVLLGWLLGWWLDCRKRCQAKKSCCPVVGDDNSQEASAPSSTQVASAAPVNTLVSTPAERAEVKVASANPSPTPVATKSTKAEKKVATVSDNAWVAVPALAALAKAANKGGKDNLEIVEGIGPKIASLLSQAGIDTFAKLSEASIAQLGNVLESAGPRYRLAKPDSWPQQAALAAKGDWKALKDLQDALNGGVKPAAKAAAAKPKAAKAKVSKPAVAKPKTKTPKE